MCRRVAKKVVVLIAYPLVLGIDLCIMPRASVLSERDDFTFEHQQQDVSLLIGPSKLLSRFEYHFSNS